MTDKAQKDKEKGNAAFKAGDYPAAIGHYTAAILADRGDATFPLNRAAAYLKLGKYEDAERDCSTVLGLGARNVKAYFRRGQACVGLGHFIEAQRDFTEALRLEPDNKTTKEELAKVAEFIEVEKRKKPGHREINRPAFDAVLHPEIAPKRRRVPIAIVEPPVPPATAAGQSGSMTSSFDQAQELKAPPPQPPSSVGEGIHGASSRALRPSPSKTPVPEPKSTSSGFPPASATPATSTSSSSTSLVPPEKLIPPPATPEPLSKTSSSSSFAEAKQAREAKTSKVGGGIFRASGQSTIFPTRTGVEKDASSAPRTASSRPMPLETTGGKSSSSTSATVPAVASNLEGSANPSVNKTASIEAPAALFDLVRAWRSMLTSMERWKLLQTIPPSTIPSFCKTSLEPPLLDSILEVFLVVLSSLPVKEDEVKIREYMESLAKVPRFPTLILFLTSKEKAVAKEIWRKLGVRGKAPSTWSSLGDL